MEESQLKSVEEEEKEEGELEEGELEEDEGGEDAYKNQLTPVSPQLVQQEKQREQTKTNTEEEHHEANPIAALAADTEAREEGKRERRESKDEKKRKHKEEDEEREKRKKKKKKKKHISSDEEDEDESPPMVKPPFLHRKMMGPPAFDSNMGFDAMLQQEMILRGRSPPPGMMTFPPPSGPFGAPHGMFRGRPMSDYDSFESGSDSEAHDRHGRRQRRLNRRFRRSRSRSRSPSRKNEAICMYYMQGSCQRGKGCPYSHDVQPQRKMELCKFYMMNCCAKKDKCLYMHKDFPCKHYHTGVKCKSADKCKFSHDRLSEAARSVLLKHIELAPKDILGDFPRLTKEAAQLVVAITEEHRKGTPMDVENMAGVMEIKGRGFKYVDKAIKLLGKKQEARIKNMQKNELGEPSGADRVMSPEHRQTFKATHHKLDDSTLRSPSKQMRTPPQRPYTWQYGCRGMKTPHKFSKEWVNGSCIIRRGWHPQGTGPQGMGVYRQFTNEWVDDYHYMQKDEEMVNGELSTSGGSSNISNTSPNNRGNVSSNTNVNSDNSSQAGLSASRKLGGFMTARMPQKQRELFQRIEQQHSVHHDQDDSLVDGGMDEASTSASNVNWYSSDEDADNPSLSKTQSQISSHPASNLSPSRTPPLPCQVSATPPSGRSFTSSGRQGNSPGTPSTTPPHKGAFPAINLDSINISSDLASVLSALKNQNAASTNRSSTEESGRNPRMQSPRGKNPRDMSRDTSRDMAKDSRETSRDHRDTPMDQLEPPGDMHRNPRDMFRDTRDIMQSPRSGADYAPNLWPRDQLPVSIMRDSWDRRSEMDSSKDARDIHSSLSDTREGSDIDHDQRQRTGDVDLRVLPGVENSRTQGSNVKGLRYDTDMRISSEHSIYDVDLRQINLANTFKSNEEEMNSLPFKVPVHTPAKEIVASISSHSPMYYQLLKVTIPKPNFAHLKINKDDPRIMEDPRLRRMLRRNSTEEVANRSPRTPSRYDIESPMSPPGFAASKGDLRLSDSDSKDSRDPRVSTSRDPRSEIRADPRAENRVEPRVDPRMNVRADPRVGNRGDPRADSRDPRTEQLSDIRNQDPRMSGMFGGGNGGGMMEGGMQFMNMGPGPMGPTLPRGVDPRGRPGLLGPAPLAFSPGVPRPMGPRMPPFMMGQMGPNAGFFPDDSGEMMGGGSFPPGGSGWGGRIPSNDPRLQRDMGDGNRSYTPPPVS
ncbi:protein suppressor of sable isoform X1 [Procambarus clarkii]|uniref:protein suppressor of sable isoform X1 n=1 Tax=Procambarus clarkii TaxID=6728 RepID=UPI00374272A2